tara:strand:+ start:620 stop:970 length:351 start_codon:yes stop_codon:yes gene_type:complete
MQITLLKSKIHRAIVTDANLDYIGSISIDESLMQAANLVENEKVHVLSITTGARIETYVIKAPANSGKICVNGAAAHLIKKEEMIIIVAYGRMDEESANSFMPAIAHVNQQNKLID